MANVTYLTFSHTHAQKELITLFDSKSTSIHSLIIQHVYTLKKWHCIHGQNGTRLKGDTLGCGGRKRKFSQLCKWRVALKHILMVDTVGTKTSQIPKGQFVRNKDYQYRNQD